MKNLKMKTMKLSKTADMKIRMKLAIASLRKNIHALSFVKIAVPTLMLWVFAVWVVQFIGLDDDGVSQTKVLASESNVLWELREIKTQTYKTNALARVSIGKAQNYKARAHIRSARARKR